MTLKITDVSSWQGNYALGSNGEDGIIIKATQGTNYVNPNCDFVAQQAIKQNKPWGIYHYASGGDASAEATHFVNNIKGYLNETNKPILWLDWESGENAAWGNGNWAKSFIDKVKALTGSQAGIYTGSDGVAQTAQYLSNEAALWFAGYPTMSDVGWSPIAFPYSTGAWKTLTGWQFSSTPLDKSLFYLERGAWDKIAGNTNNNVAPPKAPTPQPPKYTTSGKNLEQMAGDTQAGKTGNGAERQKLLGAYYTGVMAIVNERSKDITATQSHNILANETKAGRYGNGANRQHLLGNYYNVVQGIINGAASVQSSRIYTVVSGDSLSGIGSKLGTNWQTLAAKNGIAGSAYTIYPGQKLKY
ncbi:GH25 family lysozyme [Lactococcus allomyrinae]|uniref:LysM peptidoglycan-binding domain-containing protein n=1 Tax=Lactococcus allomyrinae TaxID=2419773 RepID=A0A387BL68_9LACT|nr:GH25 family lysozyme [Lactococcus allomyrinae]AYG01720.1 LysM peptidoglycan-binding domain-containing protein [Lactococcus allomyrinae]